MKLKELRESTDMYGLVIPRKEKRNISVDKSKEIKEFAYKAIGDLNIIANKIPNLKGIVKWLQKALKRGIIDFVDHKIKLPDIPIIESKGLPPRDINLLKSIRNEAVKIDECLDKIKDLVNISGSLSKNIQVIKAKFYKAIFQYVE